VRARRGVVIAVLLIAANARAEDPRKEAKALFDQAVKQAENGDSKAALASFRAAYAKAPSFRVLYNIGQLCSRVGDGACAVRSYKQYLDEGGSNVPAARRQSVEAEIRSLSRTVATIRVQSGVTDAEVTIDDQVVGKTPIAAPWIVNGGSHKAVLVKDDKRIEKSVVVVAGGTVTVVLEPSNEEIATAPPPVAEEKKEEAAPPPKKEVDTPPPAKGFPVVPWVVTGVLAAGTVVSGILAASAYASFKDKRSSFPVTRDDLDTAQGTARDLFLLTSVLGAATVVSLGVSGYFTLSNGKGGGVALVGTLP
jgi:hypothetical protein